MQRTPYDGIKDFAFVSIVANQPNMLVARPTLNAATVADLVTMARKEPGKINYASAGPGSSPHLGAARLYHDADSAPVTPDSANVGTSGNSGERLPLA